MITDWLMIIITLVYVVATIVICIFNAKSINISRKQTEIAKKQIDLMISQFNEINRPKVCISVDVIRSGIVCFVIENIGSVSARITSIKLNEEFIENVERKDSQSFIRTINEANMYLAPNQRVHYYITGQIKFKDIKDVIAVFDIKYNENYSEHTEIDLNKYEHILIYSGELADISNHLKRIEEEDKKYHDNIIKELKKKPKPIRLIPCVDNILIGNVYRLVCLNRGITAEGLAEKLQMEKENVLPILYELEKVQCLIEIFEFNQDEYKIMWSRR